MNFGKMTVDMTIEEAAMVKALMARDKAMPVETAESVNLKGEIFYYCPVCHRCVGFGGKVDQFCDKCGQRLDGENIAL